MSSPFRLDDRTVIVTGGASGLGAAYSRALADAGASVVLADLSDGTEQAAASLRATGARALGVRCDVSSPADVEAMVAAADREFGRIDGLLNNAALMSSLPRRSWLQIPDDEWDAVMAVNLRGLFLCCRAAVPRMARGGGGAIVNVSSSRAFDGTPNRLHYTTSKAGVLGFTRALAREVGEHNIRVNAIAPGLTLSDTQVASSSPEYLAELAKGRALMRPQAPGDLIGAVLFLLSDAAAYVTGQSLIVDGGKVMQ